MYTLKISFRRISTSFFQTFKWFSQSFYENRMTFEMNLRRLTCFMFSQYTNFTAVEFSKLLVETFVDERLINEVNTILKRLRDELYK